MRSYSRILSLLVLALVLRGTGVQAAPSPKPPSTAHASPAPSSAATVGTFLKTLSRAPDVPADWRKMGDKFGRFTVTMPLDWTEGTYPEDQQGMMYALVVGEQQPKDNFSANIVVSQTQAPPGYQLKPAMVDKISADMARAMKQYKYVVKDKAFTKVDGIPCLIIGGTLDVNGRQLRNVQLRLVHRGFNYLITFTALDKYYGQYEPLFARLAKSLAFEREQPPASPSPATASPAPASPSPAPSR